MLRFLRFPSIAAAVVPACSRLFCCRRWVVDIMESYGASQGAVGLFDWLRLAGCSLSVEAVWRVMIFDLL
jgi:pyrroloquinoline quinone (PQQ) biosynthesis protein C